MIGLPNDAELEPIHPRHAHIEDQAVRIADTIRIQNSSAEANTFTANPTDLIKPLRDSRTESSSSTTEIRGRLVIADLYLTMISVSNVLDEKSIILWYRWVKVSEFSPSLLRYFGARYS